MVQYKTIILKKKIILSTQNSSDIDLVKDIVYYMISGLRIQSCGVSIERQRGPPAKVATYHYQKNKERVFFLYRPKAISKPPLFLSDPYADTVLSKYLRHAPGPTSYQ